MTLQYLPAPFFCQDLESPKICLRSSHLLPLQFPFLPHHPSPASSSCSVPTSAAGSGLCTVLPREPRLCRTRKPSKPSKWLRLIGAARFQTECTWHMEKCGACDKERRTDFSGSLISSSFSLKIVISDAHARNVQETAKCLIFLIFNVNENFFFFL